MKKQLTAKEALVYLDDMAHGRKMEYDAHFLKTVVEKELDRSEKRLSRQHKYQCDITRTIIKQKEILQIIKEKPQTLYLVQTTKNYDDYFEIAQDMVLLEDVYSQKEFDLLKEWLK